MKTYDWIVIGGGITGSALAYELVQKNFSVLLLEKDTHPNNATLYSYGGLAYWSGTTELTRQLSQEGIQLHRTLSEELEAETEFRELDLILTIDHKNDPQSVADRYAHFAITPNLLNAKEAIELEPLLNLEAITGALRLPHAHIHPDKTNLAYQQAFQRRGGEIEIDRALNLVREGKIIRGVKTLDRTYYAANTVVCAGAFSRSFLKTTGISVHNYFTHTQLIKTVPVDLQMQTIVMPAVQQRFALESKASHGDLEQLWDEPGYELLKPILDPGAVQFLDGSFCLGQISQVLTDPYAEVDRTTAEMEIRTQIATILPSLANIPGNVHRCLVAFANNSLPLVGAIENFAGIYLFSGFTSTLVFSPPLARHFARWVAGETDEIIQQLSPVK